MEKRDVVRDKMVKASYLLGTILILLVIPPLSWICPPILSGSMDALLKVAAGLVLISAASSAKKSQWGDLRLAVGGISLFCGCLLFIATSFALAYFSFHESHAGLLLVFFAGYGLTFIVLLAGAKLWKFAPGNPEWPTTSFRG